MAKRLERSQTTLRRRVSLSGIGVHGGREATVTLLPAAADTGILFLVHCGGRVRELAARFDHVGFTDHCTGLVDGEARLATVEHLMAALAGLGVDNLMIEVEGGELPIMDGSAAAFVAAIEEAGIATLAAPRRFIKMLKPVRVEMGRSWGELRPYRGSRVEVDIHFDCPLIGRQRFAADISPALFRDQLAAARTFGFLADVERLWSSGLALGASLENAVVIGEDRVVNPEGLRYADEFVRHKALDAIGDLALAGAPILGCYRSYRGGHALNARVLQALFADPGAWTMVELPAVREPALPIALGPLVPAFAPEV